MRSFKFILLFSCLTSYAMSQTFDKVKDSGNEGIVEGTIEGSMKEGLPITFSEKGVVFLLTDISGKADSVVYDKPIKYLGTSSKILVKGVYDGDKFIASEVFTQSFTDEREAAEMATVFRKDGRIYVVIIIFGLLLAGFITFLVLVDRKVKKFEKE